MVTKSAEDLSLQSPQKMQVGIFVGMTNRLRDLVIQKEIIINKRTFETGKDSYFEDVWQHENFVFAKKSLKPTHLKRLP